MRLPHRKYLLLLLPLLTGACAETELLIHSAKEISGQGGESAAKSVGDYKVGKPYKIYNTWYYPAEDYRYSETGVASWYGPNFHGKRTANGEVFNMNELTAAHRTLPMPSVVRVTNLENGRSIKLRVNDRGPFARGRIIDVTRRAAQLLGFARQGTARVRVQVVPDDSKRLKYLAMHGELPPAPTEPEPVKVAKNETPASDTPSRLPAAAPAAEKIVAAGMIAPVRRGPAKGPSAKKAAAAHTDLFVQAGAFADQANAQKVKAALSRIGLTQIMETQAGGQRLYRVRLGPIGTVKSADSALDRVIGAGYPNARIVVE